MIKSKTKIEEQLRRKTNSELKETIILAKKNKAWLMVSAILASPKKRVINLGEIDKLAKDDEKIVFPGKILSQGDLSKKINVIGLKASEKAKEKILNSKGTFSKIINEIKKNPQAKGIKIWE